MKTVAASYILEEDRASGAIPRVCAVIDPMGLAVMIYDDQIIDCGNLIASRPGLLP